MDILQAVSKHIDDADFMKIIGNGDIDASKNAFGELIKAYAGKCQACTAGNPSKYLPDNPQEYIDKVVLLTKRFKDKNGIEIFKEAKKGYTSQEGAWFAMKKMEGLDPSKVARIDAKFDAVPDEICKDCRFDVLMTHGTKHEYKSWVKGSVDFIANSKPGDSFYKQLLSNFADESTKTIQHINYHFDPAKLTDLADPKTYIKGKFKSFFEKNKTDVFNAMRPELRTSLGLNGDDALFIFNQLIENTNSDLYKFINVQ